MILGRAQPELGGREDFIDVIGVNYYIHNQFVWDGGGIGPADPRTATSASCCRRSTNAIAGRCSWRKPASRTRPGRHGCATSARKCSRRLEAGVPVEGICLYPIVNHPGWDDDRHCYNGMFDYADAAGRRGRISRWWKSCRVSRPISRLSSPGHDGHRHQRSGYQRARLGGARHAGTDRRKPNLTVALGAN